ncbi:MAG: hypothetical protein AABM30_01200 [Actinomycetota bacterium]
MRVAQTIAVFLCASTLALAAAGCGGSSKSYSGTKPDVWASTVCGALGDWAEALKADSNRLGSALSGTTDLKVVKAKFVAFLENAERRSRTMITKITGAGAPAVKDGGAIQTQLVSGLGGAQASFARAIAKAKRLPANNPQAFSAGVQALGSDVEKELTATGENFQKLGDKYDDDTLNEATSDEPACKKISS